MSNINLYQGNAEQDKVLRKVSIVKGGFWFSIGIFALVIISLIAVKFMKANFASKGGELTAQLESEIASFGGAGSNSDLANMYDFDYRMRYSSSNIAAKPKNSNLFLTIEEYMIPGVIAKEISYINEKGSVVMNLNLKTTDLANSARQILALKDSGKFSFVSLEEVSKDDNFFNFTIKTKFLK